MATSWSPWAERLKQGSADITCVGIYGHDGSQWGVAGGINVSPSTVVAALKILDGGEHEKIIINDIPYMILRCEDGQSIIMKKKDHGGAILEKAKKCVLIAVCKEGGQQGNVNKVTHEVKELLESQM